MRNLSLPSREPGLLRPRPRARTAGLPVTPGRPQPAGPISSPGSSWTPPSVAGEPRSSVLADASSARAVTTIVLAEDHSRLREALRHLLQKEADFHLVAEAQDGTKTVSLARELQPTLLVTDLAMPGLHGLDVIRRVREESPQTCIIVASINQDEPYVIEAFRNGALGYVHKGACGMHLIPAIRSALTGKPYLSPPFSERVLRQAFSIEPDGSLDLYETLTAKERLALQLAAGRQEIAAIAAALGICQSAANVLLDNLRRKLSLASAAELEAYAEAKGLLPGSNEP